MSDYEKKYEPEAKKSLSELSQEILGQDLPAELKSALRSAGIDPTKPEISKAVEISLTMTSGSLPIAPPDILKEYKRIDPAIVSKLIDWTEQQAQHRRALEALRTSRTEARLDKGQWIGATVAVGGLALATLGAMFGNPWVAGLIALVAVGGPTAAIYLAQNIRNPANSPTTAPRAGGPHRPP